MPALADSRSVRAAQTAWEAAGVGWKEMGFHVDEDSRYQYAWDGAGVATAIGDLDCDTVKTTQTLTMTVNNGNLVATYADPTPD